MIYIIIANGIQVAAAQDTTAGLYNQIHARIATNLLNDLRTVDGQNLAPLQQQIEQLDFLANKNAEYYRTQVKTAEDNYAAVMNKLSDPTFDKQRDVLETQREAAIDELRDRRADLQRYQNLQKLSEQITQQTAVDANLSLAGRYHVYNLHDPTNSYRDLSRFINVKNLMDCMHKDPNCVPSWILQL